MEYKWAGLPHVWMMFQGKSDRNWGCPSFGDVFHQIEVAKSQCRAVSHSRTELSSVQVRTKKCGKGLEEPMEIVKETNQNGDGTIKNVDLISKNNDIP